MKFLQFAVAGAIVLGLAGCGGERGAPAAVVPAPVPAPVEPVPQPEPVPPASSQKSVFLTHWYLCEKPRTGSAGVSIPDRQGTLDDEKTFLRGWIDESYLWYNEVPANLNPADYKSAIDYFSVLKTPALSASGRPKDKYHFTYDSARWEALSAQGVQFGYGVGWSRVTNAGVPRTWLASTVEPGSPAATAGVRRGDRLLAIDGVDFVNAADSASVAAINAGLAPQTAGEAHNFLVDRDGATFIASMAAAAVTVVPVRNAKVIETPTGKVGYLTFASHNAVSELMLMEAFAQFKAAAIDDLVLDVRYNGGGLLFIASELAYMIAGPGPTSGKVFERGIYNGKVAVPPAIPFRATAYGFKAARQARAGSELPALGLKRVTLLTTAGTCSASESIINSLRGVDVEVNLIGGQTCGKPYAFTPTPNCGTTYFAIEFQGVNQKGFGDYADGFAPACTVSDDLSRELGDPAEGLLAAALSYRDSKRCPAPPPGLRAQASDLKLVREPVEEISIYTR